MILDRLGLWPARLVWLLASIVVGNGLAEGFEDRASGPALVVEILLWIAWFVVLVAVLAPSPRSLTIARIAGPATSGASVIATVAAGWSAAGVLAIGFASLFSALVYLPTFGDHMINGSAYGSERRMALRPLAIVLLGPAQLAWLLVFAGLVTGPILLLAERYVLAALAAIVGVAAVWAGSRVLHQLSRRWIVFVPAGFVIHDPMQIVDAVLFRRNQIMTLGPALVDPDSPDRSDSPDDLTDRHDLSGGALGLALEVALKQPTPVALRERGGISNIEVSRIVFSPTLPGAMLSEARIRGVKIGEASPTA
jgi:hypothetical protein